MLMAVPCASVNRTLICESRFAIARYFAFYRLIAAFSASSSLTRTAKTPRRISTWRQISSRCRFRRRLKRLVPDSREKTTIFRPSAVYFSTKLVVNIGGCAIGDVYELTSAGDSSWKFGKASKCLSAAKNHNVLQMLRNLARSCQ